MFKNKKIVYAIAGVCALVYAFSFIRANQPIPQTKSVHKAGFILTSSAFTDGSMLPEDLKCPRDGGSGLSPPLEWSSVPAGTESLAVVMHHYPHGTAKGRDIPSHYWLLWNIPADTRDLPQGNTLSIGDEGADKDRRRTGYTPPCSPPGELHKYIITLYALSSPLGSLPAQDDRSVDWSDIIRAMDGKIIASSEIMFKN